MPADTFARTLANAAFSGLPAGPLLALDRTGISDQAPAINAAIARNGMVEFPANTDSGSARYGLSNRINITRSNVHLRFQNGAALMPYNTVGNMIEINGSAPTSWFALAANAFKGACVVSTVSDPGWSVGDWLEIRSDSVIMSSPNLFSDNVGDCHKIAQKIGIGPYFWVFKEPLCDDFMTSANAVVGRAGVLENIVIENAQFNTPGFTSLLNVSIRAQYCAGLKIVRPRAYGSKMPFGADSPSGDFIKLINCIEPSIEDPQMTHGAYYGLSILGWTRGLKSYGGTMTDLRHAVSLVHQSQSVLGTPGRIQCYGQPSDILIHGMTARNTSLSSFDTHDTGLNVRFENCVSIAAGDDGFQFRTHGVKAINCVADGAFYDGFSHNDMLTSGAKTGAADCELINCRAINNGRRGVAFAYNRGIVRGGEFANNGSTSSRPDPVSPTAVQGTRKAGSGGILINGGLVDGATVQNNASWAVFHGDTGATTAQRPLTIRGLNAPANAVQTSFLSTVTSLDFGKVTLLDSQIDGYADALFNNSGLVGAAALISLGGNQTITDATKQRGTATLIGGSAFVANTAVRNKLAAPFGEAIISRIALTRIDSFGSNVGALSIKTVVDGAGFTVISSSYAEPGRTNAIRNNTNAGAVNGVVGSGGALPTNWASTLGTPNGLLLTVVAAGSESGPGGGTQNYIDLKFSGTVGAGGVNYGIYFDSATNPAAAAVAGEIWTASIGSALAAGSMANINSLSYGLFERTSGGGGVVSTAQSFTPSSTKRRISHTRKLTGATTAFVAPYLNVIAPAAAVIDLTVRVYMPQLEKAADNSAPIATSGSAVTRVLDPSNADNSLFEWIMSL